MPIVTYFRRTRVGVAVGEAGQELHVIQFLPLGRKKCLQLVFFTSTDPSPKMQVKMGVEKKVRMVNTSATQAAIEIRFKVHDMKRLVTQILILLSLLLSRKHNSPTRY